MDSLFGKAQDALDKFMENPENVDKAKQKAEEFLAPRIGEDSAKEAVDAGASALENLTHKPQE